MTITTAIQAIIKRIDYQEIIDEIKALAVKNYDKEYGWSVIVECHDDADILELICEDDDDKPTRAQAIKTIKSWVRTWSEQYNSAQDY